MNRVFIGTRPLTSSNNGSQKYCIGCSKEAEIEALFDVGDGVKLIEKYCILCSNKL